MAHRKLKEIKQQPSLLPGPAVPGCCLVSFYFLWAILCPQAVVYEEMEPELPFRGESDIQTIENWFERNFQHFLLPSISVVKISLLFRSCSFFDIELKPSLTQLLIGITERGEKFLSQGTVPTCPL